MRVKVSVKVRVRIGVTIKVGVRVRVRVRARVNTQLPTVAQGTAVLAPYAVINARACVSVGVSVRRRVGLGLWLRFKGEVNGQGSHSGRQCGHHIL